MRLVNLNASSYFQILILDRYSKESHLIAHDKNGFLCEENPIIGYFVNIEDFRRLKTELDQTPESIKSLTNSKYETSDRFMGFEIYGTTRIPKGDVFPIRLKDKYPIN